MIFKISRPTLTLTPALPLLLTLVACGRQPKLEYSTEGSAFEPKLGEIKVVEDGIASKHGFVDEGPDLPPGSDESSPALRVFGDPHSNLKFRAATPVTFTLDPLKSSRLTLTWDGKRRLINDLAPQDAFVVVTLKGERLLEITLRELTYERSADTDTVSLPLAELISQLDQKHASKQSLQVSVALRNPKKFKLAIFEFDAELEPGIAPAP